VVVMPILVVTGILMPSEESFDDPGLEGALLMLAGAAFLLLFFVVYVPALGVEYVLWSIWAVTLTSDVAKASREGIGGTLDGFPHHPAMVLLWWFIPIASLLMPFRVLSDVWTWMDPGDTDDPSSLLPPSAFRWWWGLRIVAGVAGVLSVCARDAGGVSDLVSLVVVVVEVGALVAAWAVVRAFHARHAAWRAKVGLDAGTA
jgi:hypothetical protein